MADETTTRGYEIKQSFGGWDVWVESAERGFDPQFSPPRASGGTSPRAVLVAAQRSDTIRGIGQALIAAADEIDAGGAS